MSDTDPAADTGTTDEPDTDDTDQPAPETDWKAEATKWEKRAKANKDAADKLAAIEDAAKSDLERATARAEKAEAEAEAARLETVRLHVASRHGIPADHLELVTGADEAEMEAKATKVAALIAKDTGTDTDTTPPGAVGPYVPSEGAATRGTGQTTADKFAAAVQPHLS